MLDIEYVSELVLQQIYSITNKKDMLETAYLKYEEDFPEESIVEEEFNIVIGLIRTFLTEENKTHFKSKTNFYSIFGTVLQFCRQNEGQNIVILETYRNNLTSFLTQVRDFGEQSKNTYVRDYSEAFTRAASDKQRR